jgi:hypothetical protein
VTLLRHKFRALLSDTFIDVDADTEEEAQRFARARLIQELEASHFIVWQTGTNEPESIADRESPRHTDGDTAAK